jgi:hypothetical protein
MYQSPSNEKFDIKATAAFGIAGNEVTRRNCLNISAATLAFPLGSTTFIIFSAGNYCEAIKFLFGKINKCGHNNNLLVKVSGKVDEAAGRVPVPQLFGNDPKPQNKHIGFTF